MNVLNFKPEGFRKCVKRFHKEESGSFIVMTALLMPLLMVSVATVVQYSQASQAKSKVQQWTDSAMMAGAVEANKLDEAALQDPTTVKAELKKNFDIFLKAGFSYDPNIKFVQSSVNYDPKTKLATIKVKYKYPLVMDKFTGDNGKTLTAETEVYLQDKQKDPISMFLVLDKSGSMGWDGRMAAMKVAVADLVSDMIKKDPDRKYVRMGAIAYNWYKDQHPVKLNWNPATVNAYTQGLYAYGGTSSTQAMKYAHNAMKGEKEERQHAAKNKGKPKKYILFLTDGANNYSKDNTKTKKICSKAKNNDNIEIFSVAFQAPTSAQKLLKECASSSSHYFKATNSAELIASFKLIGDAASKGLAFNK